MKNRIAPSSPFRVALIVFTLWVLGASQSPRAFAEDRTNRMTTADLSPRELAAQCPVVVYAKVETNKAPHLLLIVAEVWKGSREASVCGLTNGMQLAPHEWPANGGSLPN